MGTTIRPEISVKNKYWLSKHRYYELKHFCLQYPKWKKNYISLDGLPSRSSIATEHVDGGMLSNPTAIYAEARIYYKDRMEMVEKAAAEAAGDLHVLLLKAVTEGLSYEMLDLEILFKEKIEREFPGLGEFDPMKEYAYGDVEHEHMTVNTHRIQMGRIDNLIRRMADRGATDEELNRALRHAFVVIDAMKHDLDWRKSLKDFRIRELELKYPQA